MQNEEDERWSWLNPSAPHGRKQLSGIAETHVQTPTRSTFRSASLVSYSHDGATRLSFNFARLSMVLVSLNSAETVNPVERTS